MLIKSNLYLFLFLLSEAIFAANPKTKLKVYTYSSMLAPKGAGEVLIQKFNQSQSQCEIEAQSVGDASQIIGRLKLDELRGAKLPDALLGVDQFLYQKLDFKLLDPFESKNLKFKVGKGFLPFDYGYLAFIANKKLLKTLPNSYEDLVKIEYSKKWIIENPKTSSPGLGFLLGLQEVYQDKLHDKLQTLAKNWLTLPTSWDLAYQMFLSGSVAMVWSYTTSELYHRIKEGKSEYVALEFKEGHPLQIEGLVFLKGIQKNCKDLWSDWIYQVENQREIALRNWMLPVVDIAIPVDFKNVLIPKKVLRSSLSSEQINRGLEVWQKVMSQ